MFSQMNFSTVHRVMLAAATASAHLVNYSILKIMNFFCPAMISKGPTILIPHWANGYGATMAVRSSSGNRVTLALIIVLDIVYSVDLHHRLVIASSQCFVHQFPCVGVVAANSFLNFYHNIFRFLLTQTHLKEESCQERFFVRDSIYEKLYRSLPLYLLQCYTATDDSIC